MPNDYKGEFIPSGDYAPTPLDAREQLSVDARSAVETAFGALFSAANPGMGFAEKSPEIQLPPEVIDIQSMTADVHKDLREPVLEDAT